MAALTIRTAAVLPVLFLVLAAAPAAPGHAAELTLEERVAAQTAIERLAHLHRIGAGRPFDEAVPHALVERKVREALRQSVALEEIWNAPLTAAALRDEIERIAANTRLPGRLAAIYAELGHDPVLVQEALARPVLTARRLRGLFERDPAIHAPARREAEALRARLAGGEVDPLAGHPARELFEFERAADDASPGARHLVDRAAGTVIRTIVAPGEFARLRRLAPEEEGSTGPVVEHRDGFTVQTLLEEEPGRFLVAVHSVAKIPFRDWWSGVEDRFDDREATLIASDLPSLPAPSPPVVAGAGDGGIDSACAPDDAWTPTSAVDVPEGRFGHTAVWTGSLMIVWGGENGVDRLGTGDRYDPVTDTWSPVSLTGAPDARADHSAVWTGDSMIVFGGREFEAGGYFNTGGRYDPVSDTWTATSTTGTVPRGLHTAVWTGAEMFVWGGENNNGPVNTGRRYDPATDTWSPMTNVGAPANRVHHTAVWAGDLMIVWGGRAGLGGAALDSGGKYDPDRDKWTDTSTTSAPTERGGHSAVWTGTEMIVWGGDDGTVSFDTGGRYNPQNNKWTPVSTVNAPAGRPHHAVVWTGAEMIVWGGGLRDIQFPPLDSGGVYDPAADTWTSITQAGAPAGRTGPTGVWTGGELIVWGGDDGLGFDVNSGGRYDPATDGWASTSVTSSAPQGRRFHAAVWSGSEMIVWGGDAYPNTFNSGARYDPLLDTWAPTTRAGAPFPRTQLSGVWGDGAMIVWGGFGFSNYHDTGGRYDPASDSWTDTATTNAPLARADFTAVWSGSEMIVWGGQTSPSLHVPTRLDSGGRYDPAADTWQATPASGAPTARRDHTAVWAGGEMIVWGGRQEGNPEDTATGGRFDPAANTWTATSLTAAPTPRWDHTAVWTGSEMIVWGGDTSGPFVDTGGRYDPVTDGWTAISTAGAPVARIDHSAVWTGSLMVIWGGNGYTTGFTTTGGRYDPVSDGWTDTTATGPPPDPRVSQSTVAAGDLMIVWGGTAGSTFFDTGGVYDPADGDLDGVSNACDCAPADPGAHTVPGELAGLDVAADLETISWDSAVPTAGASTVHDLLRGGLENLPVGGGAESCIASGTPGSSATDTATPGAGGGFRYLARGRNACGTGTWGVTSGGAERISAGCP